MSGAHFRIDQAANPVPTGTVDTARTDVWQDRALKFHRTDLVTAGPVFTLISGPPGASLTLAGAATDEATLNTPKPGSYLIELLVGDGAGANQLRLVFRVTCDTNGLIIDDGQTDPAFGELAGHDNAAGNIQGYVPRMSAISSRVLPTVPTIAALLLRTGFKHQHVHLLGYFAPGDGGGGIMVWDAGSTATHDGGIILQPGFGTGAAVATGRWRREMVGDEAPIPWFGVVQTGTASSNATGFGLAMAAHNHIVIPTGVFLLTGITPPANTTIRFATKRAQLLMTGLTRGDGAKVGIEIINDHVHIKGEGGQKVEPFDWDSDATWRPAMKWNGTAGIAGTPNYMFRAGFSNSPVVDYRVMGLDLDAGGLGFVENIRCGPKAGGGGNAFTRFEHLYLIRGYHNLRLTGSITQSLYHSLYCEGAPTGGSFAAGTYTKSCIQIESHDENDLANNRGTFQEATFIDLNLGNYAQYGLNVVDGGVDVRLFGLTTQSEAVDEGDPGFAASACANVIAGLNLVAGANMRFYGVHVETPTPSTAKGIIIGGTNAGEFPINFIIESCGFAARDNAFLLQQWDGGRISDCFLSSGTVGGLLIKNTSVAVGGRAKGLRIINNKMGDGSKFDIDDLNGIEEMAWENTDAGGTAFPRRRYTGYQSTPLFQGTVTLGVTKTIGADAVDGFSVTNTTPQRVSFTHPHGFTTAERVFISGNDKIPNGEYVLTVISPLRISLAGTAAAGTSVAGGTGVLRSDFLGLYGTDTMTIATATNITRNMPNGQIYNLLNRDAADAGHTVQLAGGFYITGARWDGAASQGMAFRFAPVIDNPATGLAHIDISLTGSTATAFQVYNDGTIVWSGRKLMPLTGNPQTNIAAPVGTLGFDLTGGVGAVLYVKEVGAGTTGWGKVTTTVA